jgi:hypothetical protein
MSHDNGDGNGAYSSLATKPTSSPPRYVEKSLSSLYRFHWLTHDDDRRRCWQFGIVLVILTGIALVLVLTLISLNGDNNINGPTTSMRVAWLTNHSDVLHTIDVSMDPNTSDTDEQWSDFKHATIALQDVDTILLGENCHGDGTAYRFVHSSRFVVLTIAAVATRHSW